VDLTPTETDRLLLYLAASLARDRRDRGLRMNVPETIALVADAVAEAARDGRTVVEALAIGRTVLGPDDVLPGVADIVSQVQVEAVFSDGSRLVIVPDPVGGGHLGDRAPGAVVPGDVVTGSETAVGADIRASGAAADDVVHVDVTNEAPVPVSVTSHFHFFEVNPRLRFDRRAAYGRRLDVPAGAVVRFDPGSTSSVGLVPFGGHRVVVGFAGLVDGPLDAPGALEEALERARACGFADTGAVDRHGPDGPGGAVGRRIDGLHGQDPAGPAGPGTGGPG
jgi:urease subunit gamma/beta